MHPAELASSDLLADCTMRRARRSGPGGQHRNKVETAVIWTHQPSGIQGEASERRSQAENREVAWQRLRINLAVNLRTCRGDAVPSARWRSRCVGGRLAVNPAHEDFPALLAEALDVLDSCGYEPAEAATKLATRSSQLVRFLAREPRALEAVNRQRAARTLHPLRP